MKKLLLLAVVFFFFSLAVMATPDTLISKVYYNLIDSSLTAIVTHDGNVEDGAGYKDNVAIPATIKIGEDTYTVVGIADLLMMGLVPFIFGDFVKVAGAAGLSKVFLPKD